MMVFVVYKTLNHLPSFRIFYKSVLAALIMALPLYFLSSWSLVLLILLSVLVYFGGLWLFKGITSEEVMFLVKKEV